ncbi:hypothetical protein GMST_05820 [Geomonas silvestris]|uniref:histidine kinase n=1 Tax=Geomonas silvestris TaxID=2740184 RepID=A0A6V8ME70_9BACT|nr:PAS domain-containing protein [Geomonas silvestris]GFO58257.1 hypothetical protein GMST_05820 [Geomonas silvestris]
MTFQLRYPLINALIVVIAITSSTLLFLSQLYSHAVTDAQHEQEERLKAFRVMLLQKGDSFSVHDGKLWVGTYPLTGDSALTDRVREVFGGTATIFQGDVRVATNVPTADGRRALGTRLVGAPREAVFNRGERYLGEALLFGEPYYAAYDPLKDNQGRVVGAIYVGIKKSEIFELYDNLKTKVIVSCVLLNVLFICFSLFFMRFRNESFRALEIRDRKMKAILNNIPDMAWIKDQESRYVAVNRAFAEACGRNPEELVGLTDLDIWPGALAEAYRADDLEVMKTGRSKQVEEELAGTGGQVWLETIKTPIFSARGEIVGTTGIARDISQRRLSEEELRFTRYSVEWSPDGIGWVAQDGSFVFANESLCRIFSATPEEFATLTIFDLVPGYTPEYWQQRWNLLEDEGPQSTELLALDRKGRPVPIEVSSSLLMYHGTGRICSFVRDISERKQFEEKNQQTLSILSATLESIVDGILVLDLEKRVVMYNRKYPQMTGIPESVMAQGYQAMLDHVIQELKDPIGFQQQLNEQMAHPEQLSTILMEFLDGRIVERVACPHLIGDRVAGIVLNFRDTTMQRRVENHLRNSQKVEALATLTGGIAHDFNNRLTAIIGYGSLIKSEAQLSEQMRGYLNLLITSAERAADLTRGLLAYSRKQDLNPVLLDLNQLVKGAQKFFPPILGENIELRLELGRDPSLVQADHGQLEQVIFNLVGNARDAMAGEGRLTIATGSASVSEEFVQAQGYGKSGEYAILSVTDSGCGMDAATLEKIFEPFFTTKEVGKGTGLGLSIVFGIVKQHNGFVNVISEPGVGTTFWVYLPLVRGTAQQAAPPKENLHHGRGETILLVEDDAEVRSLFREVLAHHGYQVIEAVDGADGIQKFRERGVSIDVLVLDVIMPRKNGWEAFSEIRKLRGDVKALFISGYTYDVINKSGLAIQGLHLIEKPVSPALLLKKLRELLE